MPHNAALNISVGSSITASNIEGRPHIPKINRLNADGRCTPDLTTQFSALADSVPVCSTLHLQRGRSVHHNLHNLPTPLGARPHLRAEHLKRLDPDALTRHLKAPKTAADPSSMERLSPSDDAKNNNSPTLRVPKTLLMEESDEEGENAHLKARKLSTPSSAVAFSPLKKQPALPFSAVQHLFTNSAPDMSYGSTLGRPAGSSSGGVGASQHFQYPPLHLRPSSSRDGNPKVKVSNYIMRRVGSASPAQGGDDGSMGALSPDFLELEGSMTFFGVGAPSGTSSRPGTVQSNRAGSRMGLPPTAYRHSKPFGAFSIGTNTTLQPPDLGRLSPALQRAISPMGVVTPTMLRAASSPAPKPLGPAGVYYQPSSPVPTKGGSPPVASPSQEMVVSKGADYRTPFDSSRPLTSDFDYEGETEQQIRHFELRRNARMELDSAMSGGGGPGSSSGVPEGDSLVHSGSRLSQFSSSTSPPKANTIESLCQDEHITIPESVERPPVHQTVLDSIQMQYALPDGYFSPPPPAATMGRGARRGDASGHGSDPLGGGFGLEGGRASRGGSVGAWSVAESTFSAPDVDSEGQQLLGSLPRRSFQPPKVIKMLFNFTSVQQLPSVALLRKVGYPVMYERLLGASDKRRSSVSRQHYFDVMKELVPQMPVRDAVAILECVDRTEHGDVDVDVLLLSIQMILGSATPGDVLRFCIKALDPLSSEPRFISRYEIHSLMGAVQQLSNMGNSHASAPLPVVSLSKPGSSGGGSRRGVGSRGAPQPETSLPTAILSAALVTSAAATVAGRVSKDHASTSSGTNTSLYDRRRSSLSPPPPLVPGSGPRKRSFSKGSDSSSVRDGAGTAEAVDKEFAAMFAGITELLEDVSRYDRHGQMALDDFLSFLKKKLRLYGGPIVASTERRSFVERKSSAGSFQFTHGSRDRGSSGSEGRVGSKVTLTGVTKDAANINRGGVLDGARLIAPAHRLSSKVMILQHVHEAISGYQPTN